MGSMVPLPANALVFSSDAENADLLKQVALQLERKKFSGYLLVQGKEVEGHLFFRRGKPFNARFSANIETEEYAIGTEAAKALNNYCGDNSHRLSVYLLDPNVISVIAGMATGRDKHKLISTEFVGILQFTRHLADSRFSGYMHVCIAASKRCAICVYKQGRPAACILYPLKGFEVVSKLRQWEIFLSEARESGAVFSVFEPVQIQWQTVKFGLVPNAQTHMHFLNNIFSICEKAFSDRNGTPGFEELFVDACIQITDQYPFMHPFDNEVRYEQGRLNVKENLEFSTLLKALNAALKEVFHLAGPNGRRILADVRVLVEEQAEEDKTDEIIKFVGFLPILSSSLNRIQRS